MAVVYAVFRSRGQALRFTAALCGCGVQADTASAPQEAHIGCAPAARFCPQCLPQAKRLLSSGCWNTFAGFYRLERAGGNTFVSRIG